MSEKTNVPANIGFGDDFEDHDDHPARKAGLDDPFDLDEEVDLANPFSGPKVKKTVNKGMPGWIIGMIAFMGIVIFGGAGLVGYKIYSKNQHVYDHDFSDNVRPSRNTTAAAVVPQPVIAATATTAAQAENTSISASTTPTPDAQARPIPSGTTEVVLTESAVGSPTAIQPAQPIPAAASAAQSVQSMASANPAVPNKNPVSAMQAGQVQPTPLAQASGLNVQNTTQDSKSVARAAEDAAVREKNEAAIKELTARVKELEGKLAQNLSERKAAQHDEAKAQAARQESARIKRQKKLAAAKAIKKERWGMPAPSPKVDVAKASEPIVAPPVKPVTPPSKIVPDARVTGVIGNRAFVTRRDEDGREYEKSVSAGDIFMDHKVVMVDGRTREVLLDNNTRIVTGR